jgi:UDP-N-acetylglucosamine 2-epimerase (non-hydrolysing)
LKKKILIAFGTRPEAIKMAPVIREFQKFPDRFISIICVTGQHREMLDQVLHLFDIKPDFDLKIMKAGQDVYEVTTKVLMGMREVLLDVKPDVVLVHGDTVTSTAVALAAYYQHIPVAHIEAGLRTNNIYSPWPEEMNRQLTGRLASFHFAPTESALQNLLKENIDRKMIFVTGNTIVDALKIVIKEIKSKPTMTEQLSNQIKKLGYDINRIKNGNKLVLITGHRRESFGEGFTNICKAIEALAKANPNVDFVYPVHLNPNVKQVVEKIFGSSKIKDNIFLISPLEYLSFIYLMEQAYLILTDSGGIQEEAPSFCKPVLVMRDVTERPEAVNAGTAKLVGTDIIKIITNVNELLSSVDVYNSMAVAGNPYGNGTASEKIVKVFLQQR